MKHCPKCNQDKEDSEFSKRENGTLQSYCKECAKSYCRKHYCDNKTKHNKRRYVSNKRNREIQRLKIQDLKNNKPCTDCGNIYPYYVMQFDHLDNKLDNISKMPGRYSWDKIEEEISKCELVCANCHCIRTYKRGIGQR